MLRFARQTGQVGLALRPSWNYFSVDQALSQPSPPRFLSLLSGEMPHDDSDFIY
jgi:hypothetical protein